MTEKKPYGKLIGASLGPGDPELITRRSWTVLQSGARWIYPVKKAEEASYALSIVERGGIPRPADAVELVFPMTRDPEILTKAWVRAAEQTVALLAEGRDLVFLVEGDASTFATFGHLARVARAGARDRSRDDPRRLVVRRRRRDHRHATRRRG